MVCFRLCTTLCFLIFIIWNYPFPFLDGPIGPVIFTGLSASSINIQVDNGTEMGDYNRFVIVRVKDTRKDVCRILARDPLNDCTDISAKHLENRYLIHAMGPSGIFVSSVMRANTLPKNRMLF